MERIVRANVALDATADAAYDTSYHHNLRGRLNRPFEGVEEFDEIHESNEPLGLTFSNIYPWNSIEEGDRRYVTVSSPCSKIIDVVLADLATNPRFDIGQMRFEAVDASRTIPDVGGPGTEGVLETETGLLATFTEDVAEEYGLDTSEFTEESDSRLYWRPEHGYKALEGCIKHSLHQSHQRFGDDSYRSPIEVDRSLFEGYTPIKKPKPTYSIPFQPATGVTQTLVLTKWYFDYRVRDDEHRYHLNLALDRGIGHRRDHGFGFVNAKRQ